MSFVCLIIGTVLSALFVVMLFKGGKYDYMLDALSGDDFPLKSIYSVGLAWQDFKLAELKGELAENLRKNSILIYSNQYSEFYARISWAQVISFVHLFLALSFSLTGLVPDMAGFLVIVGIFASAFGAYYFYTFTSNKVKTRKESCEVEFPNAISKLALIVNSGAILREAWEIVAYGKEGVIYDLMRESCEKMKNGTSEIEAFRDFGIKTDSEDIKKFSGALVQSIEKGGGDLPFFLSNQSKELWDRKKQLMLQKGEKAASALLMPIVMMFFGVILIVIAAAVQNFSM